jgi:predicted unusual protein kinase regulating ubiquinone biosynthesis (AarF/ABC1/UbiB family)
MAGLAARTAGESVLARLRRGDEDPETAVVRAERYVELLGRSKGALMKVGQLMSFVSLGSAMPEENRALFEAAMSKLQANAPPMAPELAAQVLESELGAGPDALFAAFDPIPLAAASIGQVHAGRLHDGTEVAVKIQYPGVAAAIDADLRNTELIAVLLQLVRSFVPGVTRLDPRAIADEISERVLEELDYVTEAKNQTLFARAYEGHPFIHVPKVVDELSTSRILTQELARGTNWHEALRAERALRDSWGEAIYRFFFGSLRRFGAFYADPHPGNYLFHEDGTVTFLDFGCVKFFSALQVEQLTAVIKSVARQNADGIREALITTGVFDSASAPSPEEVAEWYRGPLEFFEGPQPVTLNRERLAASIRAQYSPVGPSGSVVRRMQTPGEWVFLSRIDLGLLSVLTALEATNDWLAIEEEMDFAGPPATEWGRRDATFWAARAAPAFSR